MQEGKVLGKVCSDRKFKSFLNVLDSRCVVDLEGPEL